MNCEACSASKMLYCLGSQIPTCRIELIIELYKRGLMTREEAVDRLKNEPACSKVPASGSPKPAVVGSIPTGFANETC